jgi:leucyl/phenylalanyl-tRNA--protein transferase
VLFPEKLKVSRSLRKALRNKNFTVTLDQAFGDVIEACSQPRDYDAQPGTWITQQMKQAYEALHKQGAAHSVECWHDGQLVGGLYGVAIGRVFFGESMFTRRSDASKVAFVTLVQQLARWGFGVIDCQIYSQHLESLGAENIPRTEFSVLLDKYCEQPGPTWQFEPANHSAS